MLPDDYVVDVSPAGDGSVCKLRIKSLNAPFNIVGMPIYLGYYVTHDYSNPKEQTMSFAPHSNSEKKPVELVSGSRFPK